MHLLTEFRSFWRRSSSPITQLILTKHNGLICLCMGTDGFSVVDINISVLCKHFIAYSFSQCNFFYHSSDCNGCFNLQFSECQALSRDVVALVELIYISNYVHLYFVCAGNCCTTVELVWPIHPQLMLFVLSVDIVFSFSASSRACSTS